MVSQRSAIAEGSFVTSHASLKLHLLSSINSSKGEYWLSRVQLVVLIIIY